MINPITSTRQLRYTPSDALDQEAQETRREELYGPRDKRWYQRLTGLTTGNHGMTVNSDNECSCEAVDAPRDVALVGNFVEDGMVRMLDYALRDNPGRRKRRAKNRKKNAKRRAKLTMRECNARAITSFRFAVARKIAPGVLHIPASKAAVLQRRAA